MDTAKDEEQYSPNEQPDAKLRETVRSNLGYFRAAGELLGSPMKEAAKAKRLSSLIPGFLGSQGASATGLFSPLFKALRPCR